MHDISQYYWGEEVKDVAPYKQADKAKGQMKVLRLREENDDENEVDKETN